MMRKKTQNNATIHCDAHGDSPFSAICHHLRDGVGLRFYAVELPPDHPCAGQAWCVDCHAVLEGGGGWAGLGITGRFRSFPGRTLAEGCEVLGELHERVRHERRLALLNSPGYDPARAFAEDPAAVREMLSDMQRAEQERLEEEYPVE